MAEVKGLREKQSYTWMERGVEHTIFIDKIEGNSILFRLDGKYNRYNRKQFAELIEDIGATPDYMAKGGEVGDYSNQTGLKKMLLDDNDFDKLLLSNERMFIRKPDVKIFKKTTGLYFTDGKREIVFNATKPISKIKKLGNASSIIKEVYSSDKYAEGGLLTGFNYSIGGL